MLWPNRHEYEKAIRFFFNQSVLDPQLIGGNPLGVPPYAGSFSINFPFEVSDFDLFGSRVFGLRCWLKGSQETYGTRYKKIEPYLKRVNLPYFVDFKYNDADEGILIAGKKYPTLRMEWVEGQTLREFVQDNLDDPSILKMAATKFQQMVAALHKFGISHGDLQSGNILLMQKGMNVDLKLIDYDSVCVPGIYDQTTRGIREYQHPNRIKGARITNATKVDYFSELVIYLSLISFAENPKLWNLVRKKTENGLLFSTSDFEDPNGSEVFHKLESLSPNTQYLALVLQYFCLPKSFRLLVPLENILPETGRDAEFYHRLGRYLLQQEKYEASIRSYRLAIESDPNLKEAYCDLGEAYLENKEYTKATTPLYQAISLDPNFADAHLLLGAAYLKLDKLEKSMRAAEKVLLIQPNDSRARKLLVDIKRCYYYRGVRCFNSDRYNEAIVEFQNAIEIDPNFKGAYRHLGETYFKLGELESALKSVQNALAIAADYRLAQVLLQNIKQAYHARGSIYLKHKQYMDAVIVFKTLVDIAPEFVEGRCSLGNAYFELGRIDKARSEVKAALKIQPTCKPAKGLLEKIKRKYKNLGDSYKEKGGYLEAIKAYQQAISIDPNYKEAYFDLGTSYQEIEMYEQAVKAYQQAITIDPNYRDAYYHLGMLHAKMGEFVETVKAYQQAIRITPKDNLIHYGLAHAYFKLRRFEVAKESVKEGLKLYPNYQPARELLETISNELLKKLNQVNVPEGMVHIPEGEFQMGSDRGRPNETPVHSVYTEAFYVDKHPVTNAQYKKFIDAKPEWGKPAKWYQWNKRHIGHIPREYHDGNYLKDWIGNNYPANKADHPVVYVSWYAAMAFAEWAGKRLPTESEWEKASRGGLIGKKYPWGDSIDTNKVNYGYNIVGTTAVEHYEANGYGMYDICGNVWEWCLDRYDNGFYARSPRKNPIADGNILNVICNFSTIKTSRVLRGGVEFGSNKIVSIAYRSANQPSSTVSNCGFRCVQDIGN